MAQAITRLPYVCLAALGLLLYGCASSNLSVVERPDGNLAIDFPASSALSNEDVCHALRYHVLDFDAGGRLSFPDSPQHCFATIKDYPAQCQQEASTYVRPLTPDIRLRCHLAAIRAAIEAGHPDGSRYEHLMLIVHGGLVDEDTGLREAILADRAMAQDCDPEVTDHCSHYYPVFVVWRSGALPTYTEQATQIEQGVRNAGFAKTIAPLTVATDLARGVVRTPRFGASESLRLWKLLVDQDFAADAQPFACQDLKDSQDDISASSDPSAMPFKSVRIVCPKVAESRDGLFKKTLSRTAYGVGLPLRMITTPVLLGPGQGAWENMQRRARDLVWRDSDRHDEALGAAAPAALLPGGLQYVLSDVFVPLKQADQPARKLSLLGHSMGAIVLTELLRLAPDLSFDNLVLMGAAVDMRAFVYALRAAHVMNDEQSTARVYSLSLHPHNEALELTGFGTMPSGSLLQWIDEAYQAPPAQLDRVLGKWRNLPALERVFPETVAAKLTFKMFGYADGEPMTHGALNDIDKCYWRASYWKRSSWPKHRDACAALLAAAGIAKQ